MAKKKIGGMKAKRIPGDVNLIGTMAALAMEKAIARATRAAESAYGLKSIHDFT